MPIVLIEASIKTIRTRGSIALQMFHGYKNLLLCERCVKGNVLFIIDSSLIIETVLAHISVLSPGNIFVLLCQGALDLFFNISDVTVSLLDQNDIVLLFLLASFVIENFSIHVSLSLSLSQCILTLWSHHTS